MNDSQLKCIGFFLCCGIIAIISLIVSDLVDMLFFIVEFIFN